MFCCGGGAPPSAALEAVLAAGSVYGVALLLDSSAAMAASADAALVLRIAVAAAAERLPAIVRVLIGGAATAPLLPPSLQHQMPLAATAGASGSTHLTTHDPSARGAGPPCGTVPSEPRGALSGGRGAAEAAVVAAVESVLGMVPQAGEPLMGAGLTSAGAVRLVATLETALGRELPGDCTSS